MPGGGMEAGEGYSSVMGLMYVFNLIVGTGALTMPSPIYEAGWLLSLIILIILAFMRSENDQAHVDQQDVSIADHPAGNPELISIVGTTGISRNVLQSAESHVPSRGKTRAAVT
ncbi:transmembrane protein 104 [Trichonephila clavata]|uniref:Transmembrane protein 104 n=1 Tax=Trichonephila clavata TaxID=2740835 RepID=A0A8X6JHW7_TRICU|nr:transmembrane protein 104 [Trichonephila clavata]